MPTDPAMEALSDKIRKGEPVGFIEALAVINYQEQRRREREAESVLGRLRAWWRRASKGGGNG
jgi:tRNA isopentenyl-2-thiomethyl-A-37 hydroxylase MiaE